MGAYSRVYPQLRVVVSVLDGQLDLAGLAKGRAELLAHPDFQPGFSQLMDFSRVQDTDMDFDRMRRFASGSVFSPGSRKAFVVPGALSFGLGRMYQSLADGGLDQRVELFATTAEALAWLGLPPDLLEREPPG